MTVESAPSSAVKLHTAGGAAPAAKLRAGQTGTAPAEGGATSAATKDAPDAFAAMLADMCSDGSAADSHGTPADGATAADPSTSAQEPEEAGHGARRKTADPLALLAPAALALLPASSVAPDAHRGLRPMAAAGPNQDAASGVLAQAQPGTADTTPGARRAVALPALANGDDGSAAAGTSASPQRPMESFAALLAQPDVSRTTPAGEISVSTVHHGMELQSAMALPAQGDAAATAPAQAGAAAVHQGALPSRPLDSAFAGDMAAEVRLMLDAGCQRAELRLNPPELGPIHIELSLNAQTADISFAAAHSTTRDGIAQALPALREMLAGQGLSLGHAGVSSGQQGQAFSEAQRQAQALPRGTTRAAGGMDSAGSIGTVSIATLASGRGMLDLYA